MTVGAVSLLMGNFTTVPGISFISFPFAEILRVKRSPFLSIATFTMSSGLILFLSTKSGASSTEIPSFSKTILFGFTSSISSIRAPEISVVVLSVISLGALVSTGMPTENRVSLFLDSAKTSVPLAITEISFPPPLPEPECADASKWEEADDDGFVSSM